MARTKTQIVKSALSQIGQTYNGSNIDDETSTLADKYRLAYDNAVDLAMSYDWRFIENYIQLSELAQPTLVFSWSYAYQVPKNSEGIITVYPFTDYEIWNDVLYSNANPLHCLYKEKPTANRMPTYFSNYLIYEVALFLAPGLSEDSNLTNDVENKRNKQLKVALNQDSRQQPNAVPIDNPFTDVRTRFYQN